MDLTRKQIAEIFKQTTIDDEMILTFPCSECAELVTGQTHPAMARQLIKHFNEEVSRKLEDKIRIRIEDEHTKS